MSLLSKIKSAFKRFFGGGGSSSSRASRVSNYGGGGSRSVRDYSSGGYASDYQNRQDYEKRRRQEQARKRQKTTDALASISKRTDALSSGRSSSVASSATSTGNGTTRALARLAEKSKANAKVNPPDVKLKQDAAKASRERATKMLKKISDDRESYNKATGHKYDTEYGTKEQRARARQRIKMGEYQGDPNAEKWEVKHHPIATSASRGALSGVTFGGSELLARTSKKRKETGAEQYYQANKSRGAEITGEVAGSLAGFGLTGGLSKELGAKVVGKTGQRVASNATARLAENSIVRRAAAKELDLAIEKGAVRVTSEAARRQLIKEFAENRARRIVDAVGTDIAINATTGLATDFNHALLESDNPEEFAKNMAMYGGLNLVIGGATSIAPALRVRGGIPFKGGLRKETKELLKSKAAREGLDDLIRTRRAGAVVNDALSKPKIGESIDTKIMRKSMREAFANEGDSAGRRINLNELLSQNAPLRQADEAVRPQTLDDAVEEAAVNTVERNADEAARAVEPPRAEPKVKPPVADEFPYEGTAEADDMLRRINEGKQRNAEAYRNEREAVEGRVRELENEMPASDADRPLRVNEVAEDTPLGGTTEGVSRARSAYERNTGETIEGGVKTSWHEAWKASQEYHASHATGHDTRLSRTSVTQLHAMDSDAERALRDKGVEEGWLDYKVIHTDELLDKVSKEFRDDPNRWVSEMIDVNSGRTLDFRETPEWQARAHYIMAVVDPSADPASEIAYTEAFKLATQMSSKAGQTNNLRRQFVHLTPAGRRDALMDEMAQILYNSQGFNKLHTDMPKDKYDALAYIKAFLEDDPEIERRVKRLVEVGGLSRDAERGLGDAVESATKSADNVNVENVASVADELPTGNASKGSKSASTSDEIMEAHADLLLALNEKNPKTAYDVVQEIRYLNMLGNPKTHIRNIFGSGFFAPIRQTSNAIRSGIEDIVVSRTGMDITRHGGLSLTAARDSWGKNPTSEAGKKALDAFERVKPELLGSMKLDNQLYTGRSKTLAGKALDTVSDFNSHLLSKEDDFFKEKAFRENYIKSYQKYIKNGTPITKKIERKIEAEAMQEAQIATFNEYNELANFLAGITRKANDPNASGIARTGGKLVNAVMPFTKVPSNIMKQSVNYSPIGIVKGYSGIGTAIKRGDSAMLNKAIDELASGTTGTGIFLLGMLLGKTSDRFTTNAGKDDAAAKFKKQQGVQNYSVTFKDPFSGETYSMTLDWLVPTSATFFAGVELANQFKKGDFNPLDLSGSWATVTSRIVEPVLETSMLSGLYSMLESTRNGYGDDDKQSAASIMLRETAQSYLNSLIPTAAGQIARTAYKSDKQLSGDGDWDYFKNTLKVKTGLAADNAVTRKLGIEPLGADTTAYGDVKGEKTKDFKDVFKGDSTALKEYGASALKNFISPANIQKVDLDEVDKAKIKQYEDAVKNGADPQDMAYLFPKKQYKKQFTTGNLDVKMSNTDLSAYNQAKATGGAEGARYALESIMFNRYTKDENGNKQSTADAYTPEQKAAIIKQFEGKSIREVEKWVREQPQFKNSTEAEQKKVIDGLWSYSKQGKSQSAKRVGEQAVIEAQGGDVNEYNFNNEITEKKREVLQPLVESGVITYEQAVDFARYAGKTYYYEDDEGGHSQTYYNKGAMYDYLDKMGYDDETKAALFNAFKAWNAKEYGAKSGKGKRRRGYRRRGYRSYSGSSAKATVPKPKTIKANTFAKGEALVSSTSKSSSAKKTNKVTPPQLKRVQAKIDLPTKR